MKTVYTFTIRTTTELPAGANSIFGEDGAFIGRILHRSKNTVDEANPFYSYDVESTPEYFEKLNNGYKLYKIDNFSVDGSSVVYTRN